MYQLYSKLELSGGVRVSLTLSHLCQMLSQPISPDCHHTLAQSSPWMEEREREGRRRGRGWEGRREGGGREEGRREKRKGGRRREEGGRGREREGECGGGRESVLQEYMHTTMLTELDSSKPKHTHAHLLLSTTAKQTPQKRVK